MAIKPGQSSRPDEIFCFEGTSGNSPFEAERVGFGVGFMIEKIKENIFLFSFLDKIRGQTRLEENTATVPQQRRQKCLLVFLNAYRNNPQAHGITIVAFHPEIFRVSYFPQGTEVLL